MNINEKGIHVVNDRMESLLKTAVEKSSDLNHHFDQ
jgi:hypothetical protein